MTKAEFIRELRRYYDTERAIDVQTETLLRLKSKAYYPKAVDYNKDKVQSSKSGDLSDVVAEITALESKIDILKIKLKYIDQVLANLNCIEHKIICLKYKDGLSYLHIGQKMGYCKRQVIRIVKRVFNDKLAVYF